MHEPQISVIIPTYNYAEFIADALNSILTQKYPLELIEIIVVDDGSTDNTLNVLHPYIDKGIINCYQQPNRGKANATNFAIQKCKGKYIFNLDADDFFFPEKISKTVRIFESDPSIVHVATPAKIIYENNPLKKDEIENIPSDILGKSIEGTWLLNRFYTSNILFGGGTTYAAKASILKSITIPDAIDMHIDEFLILAVLNHGMSFFIQEPLSAWRVHISNYSGQVSSSEKQIAKSGRLVKSSAIILEYLSENQFDNKLVTIYRLKDANTKIAFKELLKTKHLGDIIRYAFLVFVQLRPGWRIIKNYNVLNRLIPLSIYHFIKKYIYTAKNNPQAVF